MPENNKVSMIHTHTDIPINHERLSLYDNKEHG